VGREATAAGAREESGNRCADGWGSQVTGEGGGGSLRAPDGSMSNGSEEALGIRSVPVLNELLVVL